MSEYHVPVLKDEVLEYLRVENSKKYIDATLGGGGHTLEVLQRGGEVLGIDVDGDALIYVESRIKNQELSKTGLITLARGNFRNINEIAKANGFKQVTGILFDLGVSSFQLDMPEKGFSFFRSGPLDMRMDKTLIVKAADLVNGLSEKELATLFIKIGEEHRGKAIAREIVATRKNKLFQTTEDLVGVIARANGIRSAETLLPKKKAEISKRVFQALRIIVNDELHSVDEALPKAFDLLEKSGRLLVISFHSLEDRIVKNTFVEIEKKGKGRLVTEKPIVAGEEEMRRNPRSRSAKLRVIEKL